MRIGDDAGAWGAAVQPGGDCLDFHEKVSAKDFLTYLVRARDVGFVSEEPVPELEAMHRNDEAMNQQTQGMRESSSDIARFRVRYSVDGKPVDEEMVATVAGTDAVIQMVGHQNSCSAYVTRQYAPEGKLEAMMPMFRKMKLSLSTASGHRMSTCGSPWAIVPCA